MFTNWLTSPTTTTSSATTTAITTTSSHLLNQLPNNLMTTPPDIVLEVGPSPTVRFVAHSTLLAMHSGYLRSAIRIDENLMIGNQHHPLHHHHHHQHHQNNNQNNMMDFPPIFLTNVTPEQFGPLLTYMYTGYLDLTLENIFGVLLATHVLHMPRALEICRAFLSRSQAEGYLNSGFLNETINTNLNITNGKSMNGGSKVIRPIPSKPVLANLGFIVPPQIQNISLTSSTGTPFRSLTNNSNNSAEQKSLNCSPKLSNNILDDFPAITANRSSPIINVSSKLIHKLSTHKDIDGPLTKRSPKLKRITTTDHKSRNKTSTPNTTTTISTTTTPGSSGNCRNNSTYTTANTTTTTISSTTTTAATTTTNNQDNENKVIVDVASCDGPVRFRRVLNDAYGRQPDSVHLPPPQHERSHQSLSYSFHQQMAKNICQQRQQEQHEHQHHSLLHQQPQQSQQQHQHHSEESENSEDLRNHNSTTSANNCNNAATNSNNLSNDVYNCVYCKHTFKSQYCYQKHAKRHLNPLSLEHGEGIILAPAVTTFGELTKEEKLILRSTSTPTITTNNNSAQQLTPVASPQSSTTPNGSIRNNNNTRQSRMSNNLTASVGDTTSTNNNSNNCNMNSVSGGTAAAGASNGKREVRPLDMNVQYYPCKTCGSKFPSYYFVHKHRKMCHANEEN